MAHVFISYKREDHEFAFELKKQLEDAGMSTWIDKERLRAGEDWREEIDNAIDQSFALILIMTSKAVESKYVMYEFAYAYASGAKVIPIMLEFEPKEFHPRLEGIHGEDFRFGSRPWDKLIECLQEIENKNPSRDAVRQAEILLSNPSIDERSKGIKALADLKAYQALRRAIEPGRNYADVRIGAAIQLSWTKDYVDGAVIDSLIEGLADESQGLREPSRNALATIGNPAVPALMEVLSSSPKADVRKLAAELLGQIGDQRAVEPLVAALQDRNELVRREAAKALGEIGDDAAVPGLEQTLLGDEDRDVRRLAAWALGQIRSVKSINSLIEALADVDASVCQMATEALKKFNPSELTQPLLAALKHGNPNVRLTCASLLQPANDPTIVEYLVKILQTEKCHDVSIPLTRAIHSNSDESNLPLILEISSDDNWRVRYSAALVLLKLKNSKALLSMLKDNVREVREVVIIGLGNLEDESVVPSLIRLLDDPEEQVRFSAAGVLQRIGTPEALEAVEKRRQNQDGQQA